MLVRQAVAASLVLLCVAAAAGGAKAQSADDIAAINRQVVQLYGKGNYGEAIALAQRALALAERGLGAGRPDTLKCVANLASLYEAQGRYREAEPLFKRALAGFEETLGKDNPQTLASVSNLASLYFQQSRFSEAEPLYKRALEGDERVLGKEHPDTLVDVSTLGTLYHGQGRYDEAERLHKRALEARERVLGKEHYRTLKSVTALAATYYAQGRYDDAEPLYRRALAGFERALGKEHPETLLAVRDLADLFREQGRYGEAEPLFKRGIAASERLLGRDHPETATAVNDLAAMYDGQGRYAEAEPLFKRALSSRERVLGPEHRLTLISVSNLARVYLAQGRYSEAESLSLRVLDARERVLGKDHPDTLVSLNSLGLLYFGQRDWARAAEFWRRSAATIADRVQRGVLNTGQALTGKRKSEAEQLDWAFSGLVKAVHRLKPDEKAASEMFQAAQWALGSEAAQSLAQMAARGASVDPKLAPLARERQDLVADWQKRDALRNAALGQSADKREADAEAVNQARLAAIEARIAEIDRQLAAQFPDYAALASPAPLALKDAQAQLDADEALVLFLDVDARFKPTPEETFIWVVTRTDMRWVRSETGAGALGKEVQALRCGLDEAAWDGPRCAELTGQRYDDADRAAGKPLPFDHGRAYKLYQALFGQAEDLIKGKQLLIVPSGALTQLPFQVLVTAPPTRDASAAWLIRDHAITVLPAVSSLKSLRRVVRPSAAPKPMIGFGNPLLNGPDDLYASLAKLARGNATCAALSNLKAASAAEPRGMAQIETRGGFADIAFLQRQAPLPETADELCAVAADLGADASDIHLGASATESEVKRLSVSGALAKYRIVHFATHGALAGQVSGSSEPGLILTPPDHASKEDDGYLTASEIAGLKLDADWVILSACNTAAGGAQSAEALSGLARAFFYAQARALLVSHWAVNSDAAVKLITGATSRLAADRAIGRAEAMRQSMRALIDKDGPEAHPAFWAPFIVVGEGGAAR